MRRRLLLEQDNVKRYGGIVCRVDNARFKYANGLLNQYGVNSRTFLSEVIDSGASGHNITFAYTINEIGGYLLDQCPMRIFNDITLNSNDYWQVTYASPTNTRTMSARYYCFTIDKKLAGYFYVYDNTAQKYLIKGENI